MPYSLPLDVSLIPAVALVALPVAMSPDDDAPVKLSLLQ
jgi:hypothetical protein